MKLILVASVLLFFHVSNAHVMLSHQDQNQLRCRFCGNEITHTHDILNYESPLSYTKFNASIYGKDFLVQKFENPQGINNEYHRLN